MTLLRAGAKGNDRYNVRMRLALLHRPCRPGARARRGRRSRSSERPLSSRGSGCLRQHTRRRPGAVRRRARSRRGRRRGRPCTRGTAGAACRSARTRASTGRACGGARPRRRLPQPRAARAAAFGGDRHRAAAVRLDAGPASRCGGRVGERRRRDLGARPEHGPLRGLRAGDALRGRVDGEARRARRRRFAPHRRSSAAAGGTTSARSGSGRRTSPRTGFSRSSATARLPTGCGDWA